MSRHRQRLQKETLTFLASDREQRYLFIFTFKENQECKWEKYKELISYLKSQSSIHTHIYWSFYASPYWCHLKFHQDSLQMHITCLAFSTHGLDPVSQEQVAHTAALGLPGWRWASDARKDLDDMEMKLHRAQWSRLSFATQVEVQLSAELNLN